MQYRWIYAGLGLAVVAVIALGVAFSPEGEPIELSPPLEAVSPRPGDAVLRQAVIEVDLEVGYGLKMYVDGFLVPEDEVTFVEGTGVYRWAPRPGGAYLTEWTPGEHRVRIEWIRLYGLPDAGSFEWVFRVQ